MASTQMNEDHPGQSQDVVAIIEDLSSWLVSARFSMSPSGRLQNVQRLRTISGIISMLSFEAFGVSAQVKSPFGSKT
jgi:hypothetical protein